jgi:hypothetical protein
MPTPAESDHSAQAYARQVAIFRAMTPGQRLGRALQMNAEMRKMLAAGFRARHPGWTQEEIGRAVADRILHARTG